MQLLTQLAKTYANCMCSARSIRILFFYIFSRRVPNFRLNAPNARENCCHLLGQRVIAIVRVSERGSAREKEREREIKLENENCWFFFSVFSSFSSFFLSLLWPCLRKKNSSRPLFCFLDQNKGKWFFATRPISEWDYNVCVSVFVCTCARVCLLVSDGGEKTSQDVCLSKTNFIKQKWKSISGTGKRERQRGGGEELCCVT